MIGPPQVYDVFRKCNVIPGVMHGNRVKVTWLTMMSHENG